MGVDGEEENLSDFNADEYREHTGAARNSQGRGRKDARLDALRRAYRALPLQRACGLRGRALFCDLNIRPR